ncbi:MAG: hypothetical protein E7535_10725 [Ruminococcaceae bacterium]|nr:hypothetical protein [Oscillospiraceae bacterium]
MLYIMEAFLGKNELRVPPKPEIFYDGTAVFKDFILFTGELFISYENYCRFSLIKLKAEISVFGFCYYIFAGTSTSNQVYSFRSYS